ncbi:hypothetical protein MSAN_00654900 [Mycena sanguinolenta]|uniref:Uncharacterized protein n=1 Tax=Mycena sanguinolenta TaxID=230812 RepID=A0A8H7DG73_9AGAR|nr:hypothetical protein MSAN_00654900 [Mycena sanguinolenta]
MVSATSVAARFRARQRAALSLSITSPDRLGPHPIAHDSDRNKFVGGKAAGSGSHFRLTQHLALYEPYWAGITFKSILTPTLRLISFFSTDMPRLIPAIFEACPHSSLLETIVFEGPTEVFRALRHKDYYRNIDTRIEAAMVDLSAIKSVEIKAYVSTDMSNPYPFREWADNVWALLPSLVGHDLLTLTEIVGPYEGPHYGWE